VPDTVLAPADDFLKITINKVDLVLAA
jgi:hypothetical protein